MFPSYGNQSFDLLCKSQSRELWFGDLHCQEAHLGFSQTSVTELFVKKRCVEGDTGVILSSELFWSVSFCIFPYSDWIRKDMEYLPAFSPNAGKWGKNADQNNSEYGHLLPSESQWLKVILFIRNFGMYYKCSEWS